MKRNYSLFMEHVSAPRSGRRLSADPTSRPGCPTVGSAVIPSRRWPVGGDNLASGALGANTHANLIPLPPRSIVDPGSTSLETPNLGDALLNVFVTLVTSIGFFVALFLLFFCQF